MDLERSIERVASFFDATQVFLIYMFKLNENYEFDRRIIQCDCIRYSPAEVSKTYTAKNEIKVNKPKEDSFYFIDR